MESVDKITFTETLVREFSMTGKVDVLGNFEQTMELFKRDDNSHFIEWDIPEADETVCMEIELENDTKNVTGYDGVFELPKEAIELLKKNGFNTDEVE